jgi:EAL domain-containing protein (putative c-di-GMP-specific phosphodiesterase class I)
MQETGRGKPLTGTGRAAVDAPTLTEMIRAERYGVEYQPIIDPSDSSLLGYEALARFGEPGGPAVAPSAVFASLHGSPLSLFQVEYRMKALQIASAPAEGLLFLNLDPHACAFDRLGKRPMLEHFSARPGVVVELIENSNHSEAQLSERLAAVLRLRGVSVAVDDIGADGTLLSLPVIMAADYLKLDRLLLRRRDSEYAALLEGLIGYARRSGKKTILEGIETYDDLLYSRQLGVDFVQGFLFRDRFVTAWPASIPGTSDAPMS